MTLSPEMELVLLSARPSWDEAAIARAAALVDRGCQPELFSSHARLHGLAPLAAVLLGKVPAGERWGPTLVALQKDLRDATAFQMMAERDALEVTRWLEAEGIRVLVFKGPALGSLYSNGPRAYGDVDLLVRRADLMRARAILQQQGYRQSGGPPPELLRRYLPLGSEIMLRRSGSVTLDLHWRVDRPGYPFELGDDELWATAEWLDLGQGRIRVLGREARLLYLCFHAAKHRWESLLCLADIARFIRRESDLDWARIDSLADRTHTRRILALALLLVRDFLREDLPEPTGRLIEREQPHAARLANRVEASLGQFLDPERNTLSFMLAARERRRDRLRTLLDAALRPTEHEWNALPLPPLLFPVYSAYRALRLAKKYALRAVRS